MRTGEDDLDLSAYDAAVIEHALTGFARRRAFYERVKGRDWRVDLAAATLTIDGLGRFDAQLLGTWSHVSDTFLWSWANPRADDRSLSTRIARELRRLGETEPGLAVLAQREVAPTWVHPIELGIVCGELAGSLPLYDRQTGQATALLLVEGTGIDDRVAPVHIGGMVLELQAFCMADLRMTTARFLERQGFQVEEDGCETHARREDGHRVQLVWDRSGRILQWNAHLVPS
jgi:hypothetical protein